MNAQNDPEFAQNVFNSFTSLYITPEIEKRKLAGLLEPDFKLYKALVLISLDKPILVQLNDEVEVQAWAKLRPGLEKKKGESFSIEDVESIEKIVLPEGYKNSGYVFIIALKGGYSILFDFLYNKDIRKTHYSRASDFLETAEEALTASKYSVFVDTLFSAVELISRMYLLRQPDSDFTKKATHKAILVKLNAYSVLNNEVEDLTGLLNHLSAIRHQARYSNNEYSISSEECFRMLEVTKQFLERILKDFA